MDINKEQIKDTLKKNTSFEKVEKENKNGRKL